MREASRLHWRKILQWILSRLSILRSTTSRLPSRCKKPVRFSCTCPPPALYELFLRQCIPGFRNPSRNPHFFISRRRELSFPLIPILATVRFQFPRCRSPPCRWRNTKKQMHPRRRISRLAVPLSYRERRFPYVDT